MRLSEKTLEVSICAQLTHLLGIPDAIWFGLTQQQEKRAGFDMCTSINGRVLVFQFKASNTLVRTPFSRIPLRKFYMPHHQLQSLEHLSSRFPHSVFYVFPALGDTADLASSTDLLGRSWTLVISTLATPVPTPTRASGYHLVYWDPPKYYMRSETYESEGESLKKFRLPPESEPNSKEFAMWLQEREGTLRGRKLYGLLLPA
jgi:hypothetical protein